MSGPPRAIWSATSSLARAGVSGWAPSRSRARVRCSTASRAALRRVATSPVAYGAIQIPALLEMYGQFRRRLGRSLVRAGLEPLANPAVQIDPARGRQPPVHRLLIERVPERVPSTERPIRPDGDVARGQERSSPAQLGAAALDVSETEPLGGRHRGGRDPHPGDTGRLQDPALIGTHAVELVPDHPAHVFRDGDGDEAGVALDDPAPGVMDEGAAPDEVIGDVDDEQRV